MTVKTSVNGGKLTIFLHGELDHHGARAAMSGIEDKINVILPRDCVLDLGGLSFMDSSGIAVILKTYKRVNEIGGRMWVENVPKQPMKVLDASGIERVVRITALS